MPTSSQSLILLSVDGQLPTQIVEKKQALTSVPFPVCRYDINDSCMDPNAETTPKNAFGRRGTRVNFESLVDTLPDLLSIKGYGGTLSFNTDTHLLHWKVNVEPTPRRKPSLVSQRQGIDYDFAADDHQGRQFRLPSLFETDIEKSESISTGEVCEQDLFYADSLYHADNGQEEMQVYNEQKPVYEHKLKKRLSLPIYLKSAESENIQTRLYSLGFRRPNYDSPRNLQNGKHLHSYNNTNIDEKRKIPRAWENSEQNTERSKIRNENIYEAKKELERTEKAQNPEKFSTQGLDNSSNKNPLEYNLSEYLEDRHKFFDKYGNYKVEYVEGSLPEVGHNKPIRIPLATTDLQAALEEIGALSSRRPLQQDFTSQEAIEDQKRPEKMSLIEDVSNRLDYNKWKKQKLTTVRLRKQPPPSQPLAVCFSLQDNVQSHEEVKVLIEKQLGCPVVSLQFDPISVHALANDAKSRWIATLRKKDHVDLLKLNGLVVNGEAVRVRSLDDAIKDEVEAYRLFRMVKNGQIRLSGYGDEKHKNKKSRSGHNIRPLMDFASKENIPVV